MTSFYEVSALFGIDVVSTWSLRPCMFKSDLFSQSNSLKRAKVSAAAQDRWLLNLQLLYLIWKKLVGQLINTVVGNL